MTPSNDPQEPPSATDEDRKRQQRRNHALVLVLPGLAVFGGLTAAVIVAAYRFGEDVVYIGDRTISDFTFLEVTGGAALGVVGAFVGLGAAAISAVAALVMTLVGGAMAVFGVALGAVVVVGVVTGPILLVMVLGVLIKRRFWPDVI